MGVNVFPTPSSGGGYKRYVVTLTSGTSWTVPTGCTSVNATLQGGGGAGTNISINTSNWGIGDGRPGQMITTNFATTPGASVSYAIGAGGTAGNTSGSTPGDGGTTTMTGATSASGGRGAYSANSTSGINGTAQAGFHNGGSGIYPQGTSGNTAGAGGNGQIILEYWA
jgi:hypothetical protein